MARFILLDSGPIGLGVCRRGTRGLSEFRQWLFELEMAGARILIPAVIDYELRRELIRVRAAAKLNNLADLQQRCPIMPVSPAAWLRAAEFWA